MPPTRVVIIAKGAQRLVDRLSDLPPGIEVMAAADSAAALQRAGDCRVLACNGHREAPVAYVKEAAALQWVHCLSVGVEGLIEPVRQRNLLLTNARGAFSETVAEHVLALTLALSRNLHTYMRRQLSRQWQPDFRAAVDLPGRTMGIVGFGSIGRAVARRARSLGMRVIALCRQVQGDEEADAVYPHTNPTPVWQEADVLVLALPLTAATRGLIGRETFRLMKPSAFLINVGRGAVVDEEALVTALKEGWIAGAGLDVFATEPLPPAHPLWDLPGVIITPHVSTASPRGLQDTVQLFADNLRRFVAGEPLRNVVDPNNGY